MPITLNTWGLRSVNIESFNALSPETEQLPRYLRDFSLTLLRINNLVLNILGYIPGIAQISGCVRIGIGACILLLTLSVGDPSSNNGLIIGRWYKEALVTGVAQIARGILEAFVSSGRLVNLSLDTVGTVFNLRAENSRYIYTGGWEPEDIRAWENRPPYRDPHYPNLLGFLHFV